MKFLISLILPICLYAQHISAQSRDSVLSKTMLYVDVSYNVPVTDVDFRDLFGDTCRNYHNSRISLLLPSENHYLIDISNPETFINSIENDVIITSNFFMEGYEMITNSFKNLTKEQQRELYNKNYKLWYDYYDTMEYITIPLEKRKTFRINIAVLSAKFHISHDIYKEKYPKYDISDVLKIKTVPIDYLQIKGHCLYINSSEIEF